MKTTKRHFKTFVRCCEYWQERLGFSHYRITYEHVCLENMFARTTTDHGNCVATIEFSRHWDSRTKFGTRAMNRVARHEVCHLLTACLLGKALSRYATREAIMDEGEQIVRRLDSIFEKIEPVSGCRRRRG